MPWLPLHLTHHSLDDKAGRQPGPGKVRKYSLSYSESCHLSLASYLHHCSPPSLCCSFPGCCSTLSLSLCSAAVLQAGPGVLYGCGATKPGPGPHDVTHCSSVVPASPGPGPAHLLAAVLAFLPPLLPSHSHPNKNYGPLENIFLIWSLESARVQTAEIESQLSKVVRKSPSSYK